MGVSNLRKLLKQIDRENPGGLLFDGTMYYQVGVLLSSLSVEELDQVVNWDKQGRIYRGPENVESDNLLYRFEEAPTWRAPSSAHRWRTVLIDVGWGWPVIIIWIVVWVGEVMGARDQAWRFLSLVVLIVSIGGVLGLLGMMFHQARLGDIRTEERAAAARRWLDEHPRKGKSWRDL